MLTHVRLAIETDEVNREDEKNAQVKGDPKPEWHGARSLHARPTSRKRKAAWSRRAFAPEDGVIRGGRFGDFGPGAGRLQTTFL